MSGSDNLNSNSGLLGYPDDGIVFRYVVKYISAGGGFYIWDMELRDFASGVCFETQALADEIAATINKAHQTARLWEMRYKYSDRVVVDCRELILDAMKQTNTELHEEWLPQVVGDPECVPLALRDLIADLTTD